MKTKWTKKGRFWEQYEFRGSFSRLAKSMKKEMAYFFKRRTKK